MISTDARRVPGVSPARRRVEIYADAPRDRARLDSAAAGGVAAIAEMVGVGFVFACFLVATILA